jgi:hypothetical protein
MSTARTAATVDPVTVEVIRNGLYAVTEEMKTNLTRTAYNLIIYEALDFTVGLFTREGDTVSIGLGLPMFIRATSWSPTTRTPPAATSTTSPSPCPFITRAGSKASPAAWRTGSTSAGRSAT